MRRLAARTVPTIRLHPAMAMGRALALGTALTMALALTTAPATAAPDDPFPSKARVDQARARAAGKARDLGVAQARLVLAGQALEQAALRAEQASEVYNGARYALEQAREEYRTARADALRARRAVAAQRDRVGALVVQSYQDAGDLSALTAMMGSDGPEGVLDQYAAFQGVSTSLQADYQRFTAGSSLARVYEARADRARAAQARLAERAETARDRAVSAADAARTQAAVIAGEKRRLVAELARAQHVSVALAAQRQSALEEMARRRAEARARRAAAVAARAPARRSASPGPRTEPSSEPSSESRAAPSPEAAPESAPVPPAPAPPPSPSPASGGGAQEAIRFARAQLGEPYQWGATGPGSWDCSGLTMQAWAAAGRSLPHYSVAQYEVSTPIPASALRPGDLVFWSSDGLPSGIHHVALYLGGGQILHAPRTGRPVAVDSMYYWLPPSFYGRV